MENITSSGLLVGRIFVAQIFLVSAVNKVLHFSQTAQYMDSHNIHPVSMWLVIAILLEMTGSISLIAGYLTRLGALLLILFLVPVTIIFHFDLGDRMQTINLMKNIAIIGGLFMILCAGAGKFSLDGRKGR